MCAFRVGEGRGEIDPVLTLTRTAQWLQGVTVGQPSSSQGDPNFDAKRDLSRATSLARESETFKGWNQEGELNPGRYQPNYLFGSRKSTITHVNAGPVVNLGEMTLPDSDDEMEEVKEEVEGARNEIRNDKGKGRELVQEEMEDPDLFLSRCQFDKQFIVRIDSITLSTTLPDSSTIIGTKRPTTIGARSVGLGIELTSPRAADLQKAHFRNFQEVDCECSFTPRRDADDLPGDAAAQDEGFVSLRLCAEQSIFKMRLQSPIRTGPDAQKTSDLAGLKITIDIEDPDQQNITYWCSIPLVEKDRFQPLVDESYALQHCYDNELKLEKTLQEGLTISVRIEISDLGRVGEMEAVPATRKRPIVPVGRGLQRKGDVKKVERGTPQPELERFLLQEDQEPIAMPDLGPGRIPLHFDTMLPYAPGEKFFHPDDSRGRFSRLEVKLQRSGLGFEYVLIHRIHNHIIFSTPPSALPFRAAKVGWKQYAKLIRSHGAEDTLIEFLTSMYDPSERLEMLEEYLIGVGEMREGEQVYGR